MDSRNIQLCTQTWREDDGEIVPAYVGPSRPHYAGGSSRDDVMPHDTYMQVDVTEPTVEEAAEPFVPVEHRDWRQNVPTVAEKQIAKDGLEKARGALADSYRQRPN